MCVCACMCVCVLLCMSLCVCSCICLCVCVCLCVCLCVCVIVYYCVLLFVCFRYLCVRVCVCVSGTNVCWFNRFYSLCGDMNLFTQSHWGDWLPFWGKNSSQPSCPVLVILVLGYAPSIRHTSKFLEKFSSSYYSSSV